MSKKNDVATEITEITINGKKYVEIGTVQPQLPVIEDGLTYCVVRTYTAGVFAGFFDLSKIDKIGVVKKARRIWYWDGASSLSQLALEGPKAPENCKFSVVNDEVHLTEIIEVIPCTEQGKASIEAVKVWKR